VDSYLQLYQLLSTSHWLSHNGTALIRFWGDIPVSSLYELGGLDYRKFLTVDLMANGTGLFTNVLVVGLHGRNRVIDDASFRCLQSDNFDNFNPEAFLQVRSSIPSFSSLLLQALM
jgi:hypothetical protein